MSINIKKLLILNIPYLVLGLAFTKVSEAWRYANGADLGAKILNLDVAFSKAFEIPLPSFHPTDLVIGLAIGVFIRLIVYVKGKNAKKYRHGREYGSARWGNSKDIEPFSDPKFSENVILTQTENLTMTSRPKNPKKKVELPLK